MTGQMTTGAKRATTRKTTTSSKRAIINKTTVIPERAAANKKSSTKKREPCYYSVDLLRAMTGWYSSTPSIEQLVRLALQEGHISADDVLVLRCPKCGRPYDVMMSEAARGKLRHRCNRDSTFKAPCGCVIVPHDGVVHGHYRRPLKCVEECDDKLYLTCLNFTAKYDWPGWTFKP